MAKDTWSIPDTWEFSTEQSQVLPLTPLLSVTVSREARQVHISEGIHEQETQGGRGTDSPRRGMWTIALAHHILLLAPPTGIEPYVWTDRGLAASHNFPFIKGSAKAEMVPEGSWLQKPSHTVSPSPVWGWASGAKRMSASCGIAGSVHSWTANSWCWREWLLRQCDLLSS